MKIGINGIGRIGRCILRAIFQSEYATKVKEIHLNAGDDIENILHLLKYDSVHGIFNKKITIESSKQAKIDNIKIHLQNERDLNKLQWNDIDCVMECTGKAKTFEALNKHIQNGAKNVILSCPPSEDKIQTIVFGVNEEKINKNANIFSIGSCTTNAFAPITKLINDKLSIISCFATTIHSYTKDQSLVDSFHKDLRRARSATMSIIPTSTGVNKAISKIIPSLKGKIECSAMRVPTPNVSLVDAIFVVKKESTISSVNSLIKESVKSLKPFLSYTDEPLVSIDFNRNPNSGIIDLMETKVVNKNTIRIVSWYDNEWAFSLRMLDLCNFLTKDIAKS